MSTPKSEGTVLVMLCEFVSLNTCPTYIAHSLTLMPRATCSHLHLHIAIHATSIETLLQPSHGMQTTFLEGNLDMTAHNDRCQAQKSLYFSYCTPYIRESNQQRTYKPIHQPARTWHVSIRPFSYTNMLDPHIPANETDVSASLPYQFLLESPMSLAEYASSSLRVNQKL